jgi:hypothetical protein
MYNRAEVRASERAESGQPMGLLEAIVLFGGLAVILDGIGAVIGRLIGIEAPLFACLNLFLYIGAGFVAARYSTIANGVWAGIGVVSIDTVVGQLLLYTILPSYKTASAGLLQQAPGGLVIAVIIGAVLATVIGALLLGALFGAIGAAISHAGPFRPKDIYYSE